MVQSRFDADFGRSVWSGLFDHTRDLKILDGNVSSRGTY